MTTVARRFTSAIAVLALIGACAAAALWVQKSSTGESPYSRPVGLARSWPGQTAAYSFLVNRRGVFVGISASMKGRPKVVADYQAGLLSNTDLLDALGLTWGIRDKEHPTQCIGIIDTSTRIGSVSITAETTSITASESLPGLIDQSLALDLCFLDGAPPTGATGSVAVVIEDFDTKSVGPAVSGSSINSEHKTYSWDRITAAQTIEVRLVQDRLSFVRQLPSLSPYALFTGTLGNAAGAVLAIIPRVLPALLVLFALAVVLRDRPSAAVRRGRRLALVAGVLAVAPFLPSLLLPFAGSTTDSVGSSIVVALGNTELSKTFNSQDIGRPFVFLGLALVAVAAFASLRLVGQLKSGLGRDIAIVVVIAAGLQIAIYLAGILGLILDRLGGDSGAPFWFRLAAWGIATLVTGYVVWSFVGTVLDSTGGRLRNLALPATAAAAALAVWLGIPPDDADRVLSGRDLSGFAFTANDQLFYLSRMSDLLLFAAVILAARAIWRRPANAGPSAVWDEGKLVNDVWIPRRAEGPGIKWEAWESRVGDLGRKELGSGKFLLVPSGPQVRRERTIAILGLALLAGIIVGSSGVIVLIPVPMVLAFFGFRFVFRRSTDTAVLAALATRLRDYRRELVADIVTSGKSEPSDTSAVAAAAGEPSVGSPVGEAKTAVKPDSILDRLRARFGKGVGAGAKTANTKATPSAPNGRSIGFASEPIVPRLSVLSLGPEPSPWQNAKRAMRLGLLIQLVPLAFYAYLVLLPTLSRQDARVWFVLGADAASFVIGWLAIAFFLGLLYEHIPEPTGLRKGLRVGVVLLVVSLPVRLWVAANGDASAPVIAFDAVEVIVFLGVLGLLFDLAVMDIDLRHFSQLSTATRALIATSGLQPVVLFGGVLVTAAGAAVTSLLTGQIADLVKSALTPFLSGATGN